MKIKKTFVDVFKLEWDIAFLQNANLMREGRVSSADI